MSKLWIIVGPDGEGRVRYGKPRNLPTGFHAHADPLPKIVIGAKFRNLNSRNRVFSKAKIEKIENSRILLRPLSQRGKHANYQLCVHVDDLRMGWEFIPPNAPK